MNDHTALLFTRNGLGAAPAELQQKLALKFLQLNLEASTLPAKILFYTDGVKLACEGSPAINELKAMKERGGESHQPVIRSRNRVSVRHRFSSRGFVLIRGSKRADLISRSARGALNA